MSDTESSAQGNERFAKLYDSDEHGQIVVLMRQGDEGEPEVQFISRPSERMGVSSVSLTYDDTDEGWDKCQKAFENVNKERAEGSVEAMLSQMQRMLS